MRLDLYIFSKFQLKSRNYASQIIKKGQVKVNGKAVVSPAYDTKDGDSVEIDVAGDFASQGGHKLQTAIDFFKIDLSGKNTADIGCSNGGFTDCMLRHGASTVLAVDVGDCDLPENILRDNRVTFLKANARNAENFEKDRFDFVCTDVSFISLELILPTISKILKNGGTAVALVKPQFELNKSALNKKGIVISEKDRLSALEKIKKSAYELGFEILGETDAPFMFERKNKEFLLFIKK